MRNTLNIRHRLSGLLLLSAFLSACSFGGSKNASTGTPLIVRGAKDAILFGDINDPRPVSRRPAAPLGIYTAIYLSSGGFYAVAGAVNAAMAQVKLTGKPSQDVLDTTLALLQEFDTVMQVDVTDLLNRSDNRAGTLDAYLQGLKNITARATQRTTEIEQYTTSLEKSRKELRGQVSAVDRAARDALKSQDYVLAGEKQQELGTLQGELAKTDSSLKQQQQVRNSYDELIKLSGTRIGAIEENREILIAGLKVNNVPGADSLGILETQNGTRRKSNLLGL